MALPAHVNFAVIDAHINDPDFSDALITAALPFIGSATSDALQLEQS